VTFAGMIEVEKGAIKNARIAMGGVAATVLRLKEIENKLQGMDFNRKTFEEAAAMMPTLINPLSDLRASKEYRMLLAKNFFLKFHDDIAEAKV
jgi:xanthine dehydrogenase small subunit